MMAVSGPRVTFCLAKVRSHKRINWFLTGLAGRWKLHRRRHPARKSSSIAAKMARGSPSTFAASLNVEHAPQRRPCFQLKIAGRLLLDVTNTGFRTAPSRTPASLRSLGPVLRITNFVSGHQCDGHHSAHSGRDRRHSPIQRYGRRMPPLQSARTLAEPMGAKIGS